MTDDWGTLSDKNKITTTAEHIEIVAEGEVVLAVPVPVQDHETFAWIRSLRGPTPQAWGADYQKGAMANGEMKDRVIMTVALTGVDRVLGLDALSKKYPCPKVSA